jgi:hypothetical protein
MGKLIKFLIILVVLAGVSAGLYAFVRGNSKDDAAFKTVEIETGSITEKAVAVGQIQPRLKFEVKSKIPGLVRKTLVEVGDTVTQRSLERPGGAAVEEPRGEESSAARGRARRVEGAGVSAGGGSEC